MDLDALAARTLRAIEKGLDVSESEAWNAVLVEWKHGRLQHCRQMGEGGEFHPGRAANVIAAELTRRGHRLNSSGELTAADLAIFLRPDAEIVAAYCQEP